MLYSTEVCGWVIFLRFYVQQTRFVRHEVKNGLLAGIELCDTLRNSIDELEKKLCRMQKGRRLDSTVSESDDGAASESSVDEQVSAEATRRHVEELDLMLHEVLDTVLAEAMARDVVHEIYRPRLERLDVVGLLTTSIGSKAGKSERFPVETTTDQELPYLQLDPQLLRYIHRNAVSNALKYGKHGGKIQTVLSFEAKSQTFEMQVINEPGPGHERLVDLTEEVANDLVFAQGSRLHLDLQLEVDQIISSGDGAWICQKCAKTMGGKCQVLFENERTVFSFKCKAEPLSVVEWPETKDFEVPAGTWGIAIDDSKIQRKLMGRILSHAGIEESRRLLLGKSPAEVYELKTLLLDLLEQHPDDTMLVLVDENLDFGITDDEHIVLSGSLIMQDILKGLTSEQEQRMFVLVRSANDSAEDVALYSR